MTVTLTNLISSVRSRLPDLARTAHSSAVGDGETRLFYLPDYPVGDGSLTVTVGGSSKTETTHWTCTDATGEVLFTVAATPIDEAEIEFAYTYTRHSDADITEAINAAIDYCSDGLYVEGFDYRESVIATQIGYFVPECEHVYEVAVDDGLDTKKYDHWRTVRVPTYTVTAHTSDYLSTTTATTLQVTDGSSVNPGDLLIHNSEIIKVWSRTGNVLTVERGYRGTTAETYSAGDVWSLWSTVQVHFDEGWEPSYGTLVVRYTGRPDWLTTGSDTLASIGLPDRAREPLVLYSCYWLMTKQANARIVDDRAHNQSDQKPLYPEQITRQAGALLAACEVQLRKVRLRPKKIHVVL